MDSEVPIITCPRAVTIQCDGSTAPAATGGIATATDNCTTTPPITSSDLPNLGNCNGTGNITRTWKAEDACGNTSTCDQIITVIDSEVPIITCPGAVTIQCDESTAPSETGMATATDNCTADLTITSNDDSTQGTTGCTKYDYVITRTWTAADVCGNTDQCFQTIRVEDTTPPVITCPAGNDNLQCISDIPGPDPGSVTGTDNCFTFGGNNPFQYG